MTPLFYQTCTDFGAEQHWGSTGVSADAMSPMSPLSPRGHIWGHFQEGTFFIAHLAPAKLQIILEIKVLENWEIKFFLYFPIFQRFFSSIFVTFVTVSFFFLPYFKRKSHFRDIYK